jgi:S-formylglutathione hydrolase FrmB
MKTHLSENIRFVEHESEVLRGNPLGDPQVRRFPVYVPPGYDTSPGQRYPVIFGLTGFTGSGVSYLNRRFLFPAHDEMLDDLILNRGMPGVIYVFPDCITSLGGSQYVNSTAVGRYEDYIVEEVVPFIDAEFRTTRRRGCVGGSSGGIGSFWLAARHPDVFQAFADHSGDSAFEYCYLCDVPEFVQAIAKYDYDVGEFIRRIPEIQPKDKDFDMILNMVAMAACYSPNTDSALGFDLPFDPYSGERRPDVWEKWRQFDPVNLVEPLSDNLRRLRLIFIDCGTKDQFRLFLGSRQVHRKMEKFGIEHIYEEYDSDHFLLRREQERKSIQLVVRALVDDASG